MAHGVEVPREQFARSRSISSAPRGAGASENLIFSLSSSLKLHETLRAERALGQEHYSFPAHHFQLFDIPGATFGSREPDDLEEV
jgi:hypothetical protein